MLMRGQGKRCQHLNRLRTILSEDISVKEAHLLEKMEAVLKIYQTKADAPDQEDMEKILELLFLFCKAKKSRSSSQIARYYREKDNRYDPETKPKQTLEEMMETGHTMPKEQSVKIFWHVVLESNEHPYLTNDKAALKREKDWSLSLAKKMWHHLAQEDRRKEGKL